MGRIFEISIAENDKKHDKSTLMEISQVFGALSHADYQSMF